MTAVNKIDSNVTGLRYAEEASVGVLPGSPIWYPLEPNSYDDFGGEITTIARNPISDTRQRKKGVVTDFDASGGFNMDLTQTNLQDMMQGFMFADTVTKTSFGGAGEITNVDGTGEDFEAASGLDAFAANDLVFADGFTNAANNGLHVVSSAAAASLTTTSNLVDETPPSTATLRKVGFQGAAGDLDIDASGSLPILTTATLDFTTMGLEVGEWIYIGGDSASLAFSNAENNGFKRIRAIAAGSLTFDKSATTMVTEASTTETVQIFFGSVLKNRTGTDIVRRSYQLERTLGAPDDASPSQVQAQYITGAIPNTFAMNIQQADKITIDLAFVGRDSETIDGPTSLKSGTRPTIVESSAFNTSSDFSEIKMHLVQAGVENPSALFAYVTDITININNNVTPNKAVGVLGAFDATAGIFEVGGTLTAYFTDVAAIEAVRANSDISMHVHMVKENAGITFDLPLVTLGDGRPNIEQDAAVTLPLSMEAATASKIDTNMDYTLLFMFWDYLPDAADV